MGKRFPGGPESVEAGALGAADVVGVDVLTVSVVLVEPKGLWDDIPPNALKGLVVD